MSGVAVTIIAIIALNVGFVFGAAWNGLFRGRGK